MGAGEVTLKFAGALAWALLTTVIGVAPATSPCGTVTDREVALAGVTATAVVPKRTETGATKPAPATVRFGTTAVAVTPASATSLSVTAPQGLVAGAAPIPVVSNAQADAPRNLRPAPPAPR